MEQLLSRNISIYLDPTYKYLLDILARKEGYKSRSDLISDLLKYVFIQSSLIDPVSKKPTNSAYKRSTHLRKLLKLLDMMEKDKEKERPSPFLGVESLLTTKIRKSKKKPRV